MATVQAPPSPGAGRVAHPPKGERAAQGRAARSIATRSSHAGWKAPADRRDPVDVLQEQAAARVPELVPIRYGRMLVSPFTFYRGAAAVMAADLAHTPSTGLRVQLCGDAHLSNFGGFASPDRDLVFDINDFDETLPGPFEWDVKRLAASFAVAGRNRGFDDAQRRDIVIDAMREYRETMRRFAEMSDLDVWYARLDVRGAVERWAPAVPKKGVKRARKVVEKAYAKDSLRALSRLTHRVDGELRIISDPPLIVPLSELFPEVPEETVQKEVRAIMRSYRRTLQGGARRLLEGYRLVDVARKVVGVGSVGTRARIAFLLGRDDEDPLFLQIKEAQESVLEPFAGKSSFTQHGERVVEGQWLMQAASDIFLGWIRATGPDGVRRDFYVRQLWDWKVSADLETINVERMLPYARMCGWTLARAHARSGDRIAIAAYLGSTDVFDQAMAGFAEAYADQNERDYAALAKAARAGDIPVETGV